MKNIYLFFFTFFIICCSNNKENRLGKGKVKNIIDTISSKEKNNEGSCLSFTSQSREVDSCIIRNSNVSVDCSKLDTCINDIVYFMNGESMRKSFKDLKSAWKQNDRVYFVTKDLSEYISFGTNYGGGYDEYKNADIGYIRGNVSKFLPPEINIYYKNIKQQYSGTKNKSVRRDLVKHFFHFTKSDFTSFKTQSGIQLGLSEMKFLRIFKEKELVLNKKQENNKVIYKYSNEDCLYEAEYVFENSKLIHFSFGFITP